MSKAHYLFVCRANWQRSPTAERVFQEMLVEAGYKVWGVNSFIDSDYEVCSTGINSSDNDSSAEMSSELGERMNVIFTMEEQILEELVRSYNVPREKMVNLDIPDNYERNESALVNILRDKLRPYVPLLK